jgi:hypothetical protein
MTFFRLIGAAALSRMLAGPAMAASDGYGMHDPYRQLGPLFAIELRAS